MNRFIKSSLCSLLLSLPAWSFEVVGFLPDYGSGFELDLTQIDKLSQLNWFTGVPSADGSITYPGSFNVNNAKAYINHAQTKSVRSLLTLGGADRSSGFSSAVSVANRSNFIANIVSKVEELGFNGVDIDWEFPSSWHATDLNNFITELRSALPDGAVISMDVPATSYSGRNFESSTLNLVDYVNIMSYDDYWAGGGDYDHSSYSKMLSHISYWTNTRGVPASKIIVGVPFYGRGPGGAEKYKDLVANYSVGTSTNNAGGYYFNGVDLIKQKMNYLKDNGFAGAMIWEISQDVASGPLSLLDAINDVVEPNKHPDVIPVSSSVEPSSSSSEPLSSSSSEPSSSSSSIEVSSSSEPTQGVEEWSLQLGVEVQSLSERGIQFSNPQGLDLQIQVLNVFGQVVTQAQTQAQEVLWDQTFAQGIYFVRIQTAGSFSSLDYKLIVQ